MRVVIRKILLVICIVTFLVSGGMLAKYFYVNHQAEKQFETLKVDFSIKDLYKQNKDTYGWIYVKDTNINYPVMYTPDDPEHYLRKDFNEDYSVNGTPFIDGHTDLKKSSNMIIYGHHIKSGAMFQNLVKFDKEGYYKKHGDITLETVKYGTKKYKVFAFGKTSATAKGFNVYDYVNVTTESQFNQYIKGLKSISEYDTGITPTYGDKIITLSTCNYHTDNGRYVVAAVEVDEEK